MPVATRAPSPVQIAVLVAMVSRRSTLFATGSGWRVRGWRRPVSASTVEALVARGLLRWSNPIGRPAAAELTEEGDRLARDERRAA
jgi:hypothetical protein